MSYSGSDRKRGRQGEDEEEASEGEGGSTPRSRPAGKRARGDEDEGASSDRELALLPSDEDIFSLNSLITSKELQETLDVSPGDYVSSDGGSGFQLMKIGEEGEGERGEKPREEEKKERVKEVKKKSRKYRGATEEILAEREREKEREKRGRRREMKRYGTEEDDRGSKRPSSNRGSPYRSGEGGRGGRERGRGRDENLYTRSDDWYHQRNYRRGNSRRGNEGRREAYHQQRREESLEDVRSGERKGRREDEEYHRFAISPRPMKSDLRAAVSRKDGREGERREKGEPSGRYDRSRFERKPHRRRKRSREERLEERGKEKREDSSGSEGESGGGGKGSPRDKIDDLIKDLEELDESRERRKGASSSSDEEEEREEEREVSEHSGVSDSGRSEGEIDDEDENVSSAESEEEEEEEELTRSATEPMVRSKFDSSSDDDENETHRKKQAKLGGVSFARKAQSAAYSGYSEAVSGSEHSDVDETQDSVKPVETEIREEEIKSEEEEEEEEEEEKEVQMEEEEEEDESVNLPPYVPGLMGCRNVEEYEWLNRIEEGTYGVVYRAKDKRTGEIVALKKLKMEKEKEGFPITSLREINMLLKAKHPNIVFVRELVVGSNMDRIYIVMDYVEHDLKALMETMKQPFLEGEVKTLLSQLLRAVHHLHDNWILHRDLKTSNLLLSHKGILKVGDFGLAREYGSPLRPYTPVVVTLWYRAPELLLGCKDYSTPIDMWSVGCIFAEFLQHKPLFMGKSEIDQLNQIFKELGTPSEEIWSGYNELPIVKKVTFTKRPFNNLRKRFPYLPQSGFDLLNKFLTYDPKRRITAEKALEDEYFMESPLPVDPSMFPTWPAKSEKVRRKSREKSPTPPLGGNYLLSLAQAEEDGFKITSAVHGKAAVGAGFSLKF